MKAHALYDIEYPEPFRFVRYYDEEDDREFTFLTNAKQLSALDIANLYKKKMINRVILQINQAASQDKEILGHNQERCSHTNQCGYYHVLSCGDWPT